MGITNFNIGDNEVIFYKLRKKGWLIPYILIFCPLWLFFASISIAPCFKNIVTEAVSFTSLREYFFTIFSLITFVPLAIMLPISYFFNQLIVTDKNIYLSKGIIGKTIIIDIESILAYNHFIFSGNGIISNYFSFYLKNGKRLRTGNLYIESNNLIELLKTLKQRIGSQFFSREDIKKLKQLGKKECTIKSNTNILLPLLSYLPFVMAFIMFTIYIFGFNNIGEQNDVQVFGVIEKKKINYSKKHIVSGYEFDIREIKSNAVYETPVNEKIYDKYNQADKVLIRAKKGTLGIVYNASFYKK